MMDGEKKLQVYSCDGMSFYRNTAKQAWGLRDYQSLDEPTLFLGIYFKEDLLKLKAHRGRKYLFWNGSDVLRTVASPEWHGAIKTSGAVHACHNATLAAELASIGIKAEVSPTLFARESDFPRSYVRSQAPRVFMTVHPGREPEYGLPAAVDMFSFLPAHHLYVYGNPGGVRRFGNVHLRGIVPEWAWNEETSGMQAALRLNKHDGESQIVMKAILRGQYAIVTPNLWEAYKLLHTLQNEWTANLESVPGLNAWIFRIIKENEDDKS